MHAGCGGKLEPQYVCHADGVLVPRAAIAKQYRLPDGTMTVLTEEDLRGAESDRVGTIGILECVPEETVDPIYLGKAMFVGPNEDYGVDAYSTFVDALAETGLVAIGTHYLRARDQLVLVQRYRQRGLLLRELFYESELRPLHEIELPLSVGGSVSDDGYVMWADALERLRRPAYGRRDYRDAYPDRLLRAAAQKSEREEDTLPATVRPASVLEAKREAPPS